MFARILEFNLKVEKKDEFLTLVRREVLPIMKKQIGFLEALPFINELKPEKVTVISLWQTKVDMERYEKEMFYKVNEILRPWLTTPIVVNYWKLETTLCEHFAEAVAA